MVFPVAHNRQSCGNMLQIIHLPDFSLRFKPRMDEYPGMPPDSPQIAEIKA